MTPAKSYRLGAEAEADIAALSKALGIKSHAEVLRYALRFTRNANWKVTPKQRKAKQ